MSQVFEAMMLLAFGASWPAQILKTIRVKDPSGKSFIFLYLVIFGYLCGVAGKFTSTEWHRSWVLWIYLLDITMVAADTALSHYYLAHKRRLKKQEKLSSPRENS